MQVKFAKDVCGLMGIPFEMISGGYDELRSGEKRRSASNNKIFITNMMAICRYAFFCLGFQCGHLHIGHEVTSFFLEKNKMSRHLKNLLTDVYTATFGGGPDSVDIIIRATPRIEISSVEEICQLLETGVVSHQNAMDLSNMIFGVDLKQGIGKDANAGLVGSSMFTTPQNKVSMISAEAHRISSEAQKKKAASSLQH